ncbi:hypothetical protein [Halomontanus rarus]|uniref:hypothetical protein n=1 Tax=Halomontanus rarus TaxID=3034020 RepID=UPI00307BF9C9
MNQPTITGRPAATNSRLETHHGARFELVPSTPKTRTDDAETTDANARAAPAGGNTE